MLYFIRLALQVLEHCRFFDNVVSELVPLHIPIPIDIDFVEEEGQIAHQGNLSIRDIILPEFQVFFGDDNELMEIQLIIPLYEFFLQEINCELVEVQSHIRDHFFIGGLDLLVSGTWGVDWHHLRYVPVLF